MRTYNGGCTIVLKRWLIAAFALVALLALVIIVLSGPIMDCMFCFERNGHYTEVEGAVIEAWFAQYDGPGHGWGGSTDKPKAMVVDHLGNVYVTGICEADGAGDDYATIKYDSNGNQLWVARYDGGINGHDHARGLAFDELGNVYVTGRSYGSGTGYDVATVKYDGDGNQKWVRRYSYTTSGYEEGLDIAVDESGNIYVTGQSGNDYVTIKYDSRGNMLWAVAYDGSSHGSDRATAIAVHTSGYIYVAGTSNSNTGEDYVTIKYDENGNEMWVARYTGPGSGSDRVKALVLDDVGNVYVTGCSFGRDTRRDYATIKYDSNGNQLWVARYDGPSSDTDEANDIAVDSYGNVYVTGYSVGESGKREYTTIKYDRDGNQLWIARYQDGEANSVAIDGMGNVYVTGHCGGDYATVKYDTDGNQLWVALYNGPLQYHDEAIAVAVSPNGDVYVTGSTTAGSCKAWLDHRYYTDYATIKYTQ